MHVPPFQKKKKKNSKKLKLSHQCEKCPKLDKEKGKELLDFNARVISFEKLDCNGNDFSQEKVLVPEKVKKFGQFWVKR